MNGIKDVAKLAGVSITTVSRVINNSENVSDKVRERVKRTMEELKYTPNTLAKTMRTQRSNYIGVIVSDISDPFFAELYGIIESVLNEYGYNSILLNSRHKDADQLIQSLYHWNIEGVIICFSYIIDKWDELVSRYPKKIPFVLLQTMDTKDNYNKIYINVEDGMYKAVKYLIQQGHTRIAYLRGDSSLPDGRYKGYLKALQDAGIEIDEKLLFECEYDMTAGQMAAASIINMERRPTGIVAVNDNVASGALKFFLKNGVNVPEDISIVGFDDNTIAKVTYPELTTVRIPIKDLGKSASKMILNSIKNQNANNSSLVLETELIIRGSTK